MLKSIIFKCNGNSIDLISDPKIKVVDIQGISPTGIINTSGISGYDGESVISSHMGSRNITMVLHFMEIGIDSEVCKHRLYNCFPVKAEGVLCYRTATKNVKIDCVVEKIEIPPNVYPMQAQLSLICPNPYFADLSMTSKVMSGTQPLFKFPHLFNGGFMFGRRAKSVIDNFYNESTVDVYPIVEFKAINALSNPSIINVETYEKMKVNIPMVSGDTIVIDTRIGHKSIIKNGSINCFNHMDLDFIFFKLRVGNNYLKYDADGNSNSLQTTVSWETLYGGM